MKRVSVCMASYNGERFIGEQLQSILAQLKPHDELIVVDDASSDGTREVIAALRDSRIRMVCHSENHGVVRSFEESVRLASGDFIFLSDQDDIWESDKVFAILSAFDSRPDVDLVISDASLVDDNGDRIAPSFFDWHAPFRHGVLSSLLRNRFVGCMMAFRRTLLPDILPFPIQRGVLHDLWIGTRSRLSGHRCLFIDRPLMRYRRHSGTATGRVPLNTSRRIRNRTKILVALAQAVFRPRVTGSTQAADQSETRRGTESKS